MLPASKAWLSNRGFTIPQIERMNKDKRLGSVDLCFRVDGRQILPRPRSANSRFVGQPYLIWSDPVNGCESVGSFLLLFEDRTSSSRGRCERRLISLIFAGRNRIILIRRELPLTYVASPAKPVAKGRRGFSFVPTPAAAGPVLEVSTVVHSLGGLCFFLL